MFALKGLEIPKTHYIDELARGLKLKKELLNSISELTVDYTFARYPDVAEHVPYEEYTEEIAKEKVKTAKDVFAALEEHYRVLPEKEDE